VTWQDFDEETALERDTLQRSLPLVPVASDGDADAVIDMATGHANVGLHVRETLGATPDSRVELLGIRPLLVSAAWKVIDLLLEEAYEDAGLHPDAGRRWSIDRKAELARAATARPAAIDARPWEALTRTYVDTVEVRHSLVHRRAHLDGRKALVGVRSDGTLLRPLVAAEQEAFGRAALRAAELVIGTSRPARVQADLVRQLGYLTARHGVRLPAVALRDAMPGITVIVYPQSSTETTDAAEAVGYAIDLRRVREVFAEVQYADLTVRIFDQPNSDLHGNLEDAPTDDIIIFDPERPPGWLT
jgi:hypothetical protein